MDVFHKLEDLIKEKDDVDEVNCWQSRYIKNNCAVCFWLKKNIEKMEDKDTKNPQPYSFFLVEKIFTTTSRQKSFVTFHNRDQLYETQSEISDDHILKLY